MANNRISNIYINLSMKCMKKCYIKTKKKKKKKSYWTNSQFLALRGTVNSYSKKMKLSPFDHNIRNTFITYCKKLRKMSKEMKREHKQNIINTINNLSPNKSKEFWKIKKKNILKIINNDQDENHLDINLNKFVKHFKDKRNPENTDKDLENKITVNLLKEKELLTNKNTDLSQ